jgi:thioredoxin reductase (NADPH)
VPGEDLAKTAYRLLEPEAFQHTHCLVVGGGDSAVEAALALAAQEGNRVTLSYRQDSLSRPRPANRDAIAAAAAEGRVQLLLSSQVIAIGEDRVRLSTPQGEQVLANDGVWIFAGGVLPTRFLHKAGIAVETHFGERVLTGAPGVS